MRTAVLYVRRSTNERMQADSLRVQEQVLRRYAREHEMQVISVFSDSASGTSSRRAGFQAMVNAITSGLRIDAVLCRDMSRFGRFLDVDEGAYFEALFLAAGAETIYADEPSGGRVTPMTGLVKAIRRVMASEYSRDKSRLIRYAQARRAAQGYHVCGPAPYAMKRVAVDAGGLVVCEMERGEWKKLSTHRTRLLPGNADEVRVVQSIFNGYCAGTRTTTIAARLNAAGIPAPAGGKWWEATILAILRNPVYTGTNRYRPSRNGFGQHTPRSAKGVTVENSFPAIVTRDLWNAANVKLKRITRLRPDADLAGAIRQSYEQTGFIASSHRFAFSDATIRMRFACGVDGALELAYQDVVTEAGKAWRLAVERALRDVEASVRSFRSGLLALITPRAAFLHRLKHGVRWCLPVSRLKDPVVVGTGIEPSGRVRWFTVDMARLQARCRAVYLRLDAIEFVEDVHQAVDAALVRLRRSAAGVAAIQKVAETRPVTVISELARDVGWPPRTVSRVLRQLKASGAFVPTQKYKAGRRLEVRCDDCGGIRPLVPSDALGQQGEFCVHCARNANAKQTRVVRCPLCGATRKATPSAIRKLSGGGSTVCRKCRVQGYALERGRNAIRRN